MTSTFPLRRAGVRISALASLGAIMTLTTGGLSALLMTSPALTDAGVREALAASGPTASAVRITTRLADDPEPQDDELRSAIARAMRAIPVEVTRSLETDAVPVSVDGTRSGDTGSTPTVLISIDDLPALAELVDGEWAASADEAVVQADAAAELGVQVGEEIAVAGSVFTVAGTWVPRDAGESAWFGDPAIGSGEDEGAAGPVVVDAAAVAALDLPTDARWTIVPKMASVDAAELSDLSSALDRLAEEVRVLGSGNTGGIALAGTLDRRLADLGAVVLGSSAVLGVPLALIALLGAIAAGIVLRLMVGARREENVLLRTRGASRTRLVVTATGEASIVALVGTVIGTASAAGVIAAIASPAALVGATPALVVVAVTAVVVIAVISAVVSLMGMHDTGVVGREDSRAAAVFAIVPLAISIPLAGLALTQFLVLGSPLAAGGQRADPLALAAPTLVVVALVLLTPMLARPLFAAAEAYARRRPGILPVLPLRQLTRRARSVASAVLIVALAAGASLLASVYAGSSAASEAQAERASTGADVRVRYERVGDVSERLAGADSSVFASLATVDDALAVVAADLNIGPDSVPTVAADPARLAVLTSDSVLSRVTPALTATPAGVALPDGAAELRVELEVRADAGVPADTRLVVVAWLADIDGAPRRTEVGRLSAVPGGTSTASLTAAIPASRSVLALEYEPTALPGDASLAVSLTALSAGDTVVPWVGDAEVRSAGSSEPFRLLPESTAEPVPVVLSSAVATRIQGAVGDSLSISAGARPLSAEIVGIVDRIPGIEGGSGALIDLETLVAAQLAVGSRVPAPDEVWISTSRPDATVAAIRDELTRRAEVVSGSVISRAPVLGPSVELLWAGLAVSVTLAMIGFAAVTRSLERARRPEALPLRSQGLARHALGQARAIEIVATAVVALVLGAAAGIVTAALVVPGLVQATTGESAVGWAVGPFVMAATVVVATTAVLALLAMRATGRRGAA